MPKKKQSQPGMKIPAIRQLPSGSWFCQLRIDGQSISITDIDYDTVMAKAYAYKAGVMEARKAPKDVTVGEALQQYIERRRNILSPSTLRGYGIVARNRFKALQARRISTLTQNIIQRDINLEIAGCSPKTLRNAYMLIASAIEEAGGEKYDVRLPQVPKSNKVFLDPEQITKLTEAVKGTEIEIPVLLGLWSCRRSEIFGLTWDSVDLDKRTIRIERSVVPDEEHHFVQKNTTKTRSSSRTIPISDQLYAALLAVPDKNGSVVPGHPNTLFKRLNRTCDEIGLPQIGIHGLRHSFASLAYSLGLPAKVTMQIGGWENDNVMLKIYTHISEREVNDSAAAMLRFFDGNSVIANESANKS